jgi:hypothetical protein
MSDLTDSTAGKSEFVRTGRSEYRVVPALSDSSADAFARAARRCGGGPVVARQ